MFDKLKNLYYFSWLSVLAQSISCAIFLRPYFHLIKSTSIEFVGKKPDPNENYIVVSNHRSYTDPPLLGFAIDRPTAFVAKQELFSNPLLYLYMVLTSTIAINRENPESKTFKAAKKALSTVTALGAWSLGIFIEGTRSQDEHKLAQPNKGPIFIAKLTKTKIIPMGISYRGKKDIIVKIGEPYEIDYKGDLDDQAWECLEKISELCDYAMPVRS
ncbi:MAG: lysophospholipid acyltransferase family protein [Cyanobacteria bacterium]|nr:lysophospholipid acyltransferase family protein [Cyanobacteriota bacterium]MDA1020743.1 lysophospholipid acyltransferase family protein [Cyanobacteriota bacterium]